MMTGRITLNLFYSQLIYAEGNAQVFLETGTCSTFTTFTPSRRFCFWERQDSIKASINCVLG